MTGRGSTARSRSLRVDSTHEETRRARMWVGDVLHDAGCDAEYIGDVLLALGEALSNIVRHGYDENRGHPIDVTVIPMPECVEFLLEDEAPLFLGDGDGCGTLPDPSCLAEGGYGMYLIRSLMDDVVREPRGERGNRLRLRKFRPAADLRRNAS